MWNLLRGKKRPASTAEGTERRDDALSNLASERRASAAQAADAEKDGRADGDLAGRAEGAEGSTADAQSTGRYDVVVDPHLDDVGAGIAPEQDEDDLPTEPREHRPLSREDLVADALDQWAQQITGGVSAPSFLTQIRAGSTVLELTHSHPSGLAQLLAGRGPTRLSSLVREVGALADARAHARTIREIAERHAEEIGLTTCHLGIGEATWFPEDGSEPIHAPVLVRPITLSLRGNAREDVDLEVDTTADLNPVLLRSLREAGVAVDARALLATTDGSHGFDPNPVLDAFRSLGQPLPGFRITHALVVGNLMDAAGSVGEDLAADRTDWVSSPLVAALAGDAEAQAVVRSDDADQEAVEVPEHELVSAVDPDHRAVLARVLAGQDLAVAVPPGNGSLDLVVDLAEELNARGRSVLIVSQRRRNLAQLVATAQRRGLEELVFDLSPDPSLQRNASAALLRSLRRAGSHALGPEDAAPAELGEMRDILVGHVEAMHRVQQPWDASAHDAISALAALTRLRPSPRTQVRLRADVAAQMIGADRDRFADALREAAEVGVLTTGPEETAWYGAPISSDTQAARAEELVDHLREEILPQLRAATTQTGDDLGLATPATLQQLTERLGLLDRVRVLLGTFQPAVFRAPLPDLVAATADKAWRLEHGVTMGFGLRRRLRKDAAALQRPAALSPDLYRDLSEARRVADEWHRVATIPTEHAEPSSVPAPTGSRTDSSAPGEASAPRDTSGQPDGSAQPGSSAQPDAADGTAASDAPRATGSADTLGDHAARSDESAATPSAATTPSVPSSTSTTGAASTTSITGATSTTASSTTGTPSTPALPADLDRAHRIAERTLKVLDELAVLLDGTATGSDLARTDLDELERRVEALAADRADLESLPRRTELLRRLSFDGLGDLVEDLRTRRVPTAQVGAELELCWWGSVLELIAGAEPTISQYDGTSLSEVAERFRRLDHEDLAGASARVHAAADENRVRTMKAYPDTSRAAIAELARSSTVSIRDLAAKYEDILFAARPTWLASPYLVAQVLPRGRHFDVLIVADGGRLPTAAALPSIVRAEQTVVVGDPLEYGGDAVPSLLDDMLRIAPHIELLRDAHHATEGLRGFAQRRALVGDVAAVPSPVVPEQDRLVVVENGRGPVTEGMEYVESTEAELRRVTDLVIEHARTRPERSLAVLTFTEEHARRLMERIMNTVSVIPALRDYFDPAAREVFTVLPASQATSMVRDDIIVSVGFGKTPHGRLLHRFGPLSEAGGRKALATVITRARGRTTVVSSIDVQDLDHARLRSEGARDLRAMFWVLRGGADVAVVPHVAALTGREDPIDPPVLEQPRQSPAASLQPADTTTAQSDGAAPTKGTAPTQETASDLSDDDLDAAIAAALARKSADSPDSADPASEGAVDADGPAPSGAGQAAEGGATVTEQQAPAAEATSAEESGPEDENDPAHEDPEPVAPRQLETDALVRDLADRLWRLGLLVESDFGLSSDRIELALGHPDMPGRLLVAVDTDGARYVGTASQRERDRLRAERLEAAGWATERVWSWALFIDPDGEAERIRRAVERALRLVQSEELSTSPEGAGTVRHRLPRPQIPAGHQLSFYSSEDFDAIVEYICSDGRARLEEHLATEVRSFLGFEQRSVLLDVSVSSAIRRYQERQ